jgi:hypothetical protein
MQPNAYVTGPHCRMCLCAVFSLSMDCHKSGRHKASTLEACWDWLDTSQKASKRVTISLHENDKSSSVFPLAFETCRSVLHKGRIRR